MIEGIDFYMKIPLPDGTFTNGKIDYTSVPKELGLQNMNLAGMRVLDIAANDGFWTFWAEQAGSTDILAIDVDGFEGYDWGWDGPPAELVKNLEKGVASNWKQAGAGFRALHQLMNSKARREQKSIYQLDPQKDGMFDLIFNFGLLYHLRHPLLSLDKTRAVCCGAMVMETHLVNGFAGLPVSLFYRRNECQVITNWTGPTEAVVVQWLVDAGYPRVFSNRTNTKAPFARRIFLACVNNEWAMRFAANPQLVEFDEDYHNRILINTKKQLGLI